MPNERAKELRSRSRAAGMDPLKNLLALSTGAVAFAKLADGTVDVGRPTERRWVVAATGCFLVVVFVGLLGWFATFEYYYLASKAEEGKASDRQRLWRDTLKRTRVVCFFALPWCLR